MPFYYWRPQSWGYKVFGAVERSRTSDLLITNQLLYQLSDNSLVGKWNAAIIEQSTVLRGTAGSSEDMKNRDF